MAEASRTPRALVIALGNPLAGDDAFGPRVLECLLQEGADQRGIDLLDAHTDLLGAIDRFPEYGLVVVVDAVLDPAGTVGKPGEIVVLGEDDLRSWPDHSPNIHRVSPLLGLRLFRELHPDAPARIALVLLCVSGIELGAATGSGFAPGLANGATVALAAREVRRILASLPPIPGT